MSSPAPQRPPRSRGNPSMGDVVRSVVVLAVIVLGIWAFGQLQSSTPDDPVREVEYVSTAQSARTVATYPVLAPASLPEGWRANGVRFDPADSQPWHLGVLTGDDRYIGLEQEKAPVEDLIEAYAEGAEESDTVDVAGTTWVRYDGPDDRITLVQETPEVTTIVTTSTAPLKDLERFISRLSSV